MNPSSETSETLYNGICFSALPALPILPSDAASRGSWAMERNCPSDLGYHRLTPQLSLTLSGKWSRTLWAGATFLFLASYAQSQARK